MSASLVGSEMCIRDSPHAMGLVDPWIGQSDTPQHMPEVLIGIGAPQRLRFHCWCCKCRMSGCCANTKASTE
eukprot:10900584-Alexandrium_andersonii.AAC.1